MLAEMSTTNVACLVYQVRAGRKSAAMTASMNAICRASRRCFRSRRIARLAGS